MISDPLFSEGTTPKDQKLRYQEAVGMADESSAIQCNSVTNELDLTELSDLNKLNNNYLEKSVDEGRGNQQANKR